MSSDAGTDELLRRLRRMLDEEAARRLTHLYCRALDRCDENLLRTLYERDALIEHGPFRGDVDAFCSMVLNKMRGIAQASHHVTNVLIEIDQDEAISESYFVNVASAPDRPYEQGLLYDRILTGRYLDRLMRHGDTWKIRHRRVVYDTVQLLAPCPADADPHQDAFKPRGRRDNEDALYVFAADSGVSLSRNEEEGR